MNRSAIESSRPPGHFAHVQPLLDRYCDLMLAILDLHKQLRRIRPGTPRRAALVADLGRKSREVCELFEMLHLGPAGRGLPPPRMQ